METRTFKFYDYDELDEAAKKTALEHVQKILDRDDNYFQCQDLSEQFKETLLENGLGGCKCYWSLSCCQGDGVAFYGRVDLGDFIRAKEDRTKFIPIVCFQSYPPFSIEIKNTSTHYNHYNTMHVDVEYHDDDDAKHCQVLFKTLIDEFIGYFQDFIKNLSREMEKSGYEFLEYYTTEAYYISELQSGNYKITRSGHVYLEHNLPEEEDDGDAVGSAAEPVESVAV